MDRGRIPTQPSREISHWHVTKAADGTFIKTPVYEAPAIVQPEIVYADAAPQYEATEELEQYADNVYDEDLAVRNNRRFRGRSLAAVGIFLTTMTGITYATDFGITYVKDHKNISPADAYKDFTELPGLIEPLVGAVQTITSFNGNK